MNNVEVFHQCGHNFKWNEESFLKDKVGNGLIISPVNMEIEKVLRLKNEIKNLSFFDSQFYLPRSGKPKLNKYEFFPNNISDGYKTTDYLEHAYESAKLCVDFQLENQFKYVVIPTFYYDDIPSNYIELLKEMLVEPFLKALKERKNNRPVLLSLIVKDIQLNDRDYRDDILNFITSYREISGIYLIPHHKGKSKRIKDVDFLFNLLVFIDLVRQNGMSVHVGYNDIEGYLLSLADVSSISIGAYENLRRFDSKRFEKQDKKKMNGPTPRLYSSKLFQWMDYRYLESLKDLYPGHEELFDNNKYKILMFKPEFNWHFSKPEIYKHYFLSMYRQIRELPAKYKDRFSTISNNLNNAIKYFEEINNCGILLDEESNGSHLNYWVTAINRFKKYKEVN